MKALYDKVTIALLTLCDTMSEIALEKKKISLGITVAVAAVLVIAGGVTAIWSIAQRQATTEVPTGADLIPQDALMAISVTTDTGQWRKLREFGTPESQAWLDKNLTQLRDRFLTSNGFNYEQDVQPWVGDEVTIGVLPPFPVNKPSEDEKTDAPVAAFSGQQSVVLVLPIENVNRAKQVLQNAKPPQNGKWVDRTYKEVEIKETQGVSPENHYSVTVLDGRYLVLSRDDQAIESTIDTFKGAASVADTPGGTKAWEKIKIDRPFARLYLNMPVLAAVSSLNQPNPDPVQFAEKQQNQGLATSVSLESEGIRLNTVSWLKPNSERKYVVQNNGKTMPTRLPADTLMMMSGGNLQRLWEDYAAGAQDNPIAPLDPDWLRRAVKNTTNLDLEKDLLSWMRGEFSLSLVPPGEETPSNFPFGVVLMVQASDRRAAEETLKKLDQVMSQTYNYKVEQTKVADQPVVKWTSQQGAVTVSHGWLNGNVAFLSFLAPVSDRIVPQPKTPLAMSDKFQKIVPLDDDMMPNNGHFFMDLERTIHSNTPAWLQLPPEQKAAIDAIRALGLTAVIDSNRTTLYELFVALKKAGTTAPLPSPGVKETPAAPQQSTPQPKPSPQQGGQ